MNKLLLFVCFLIGIFLYLLLKKSCKCKVVEGQLEDDGRLTVTIPQIRYNMKYTPYGITQYNGDPIEFNLRLLTEYGPIEGADDGNTFNIFHLTPANRVMTQLIEYEHGEYITREREIFGLNDQRQVLLYVNTNNGDIYILLPFIPNNVLLRANNYDGNNLTLDPTALDIYGGNDGMPSVDPTLVPDVVTRYFILETINRYVLLTRATELEINTFDSDGNLLSLEEIKTLVDLAIHYIERYGEEEGMKRFNQDYTPGEDIDIELLSLRLRSLICQQYLGGGSDGSDAVSRRL
jgi:hypothetical protein